MDQQLEYLARSYADADSLEELVRPLLDLAQQATGMDSVYLTLIDQGEETQTVIYARNSGELQLNEGLTVPWEQTLCRRALTEKRTFVGDVPELWPDANAAHELGIRSYLSLPVFAGENRLFGTLCGASTETVPLADDGLAVMDLCASLIRSQIGHDRKRRAIERRFSETEQRLQQMSLIAEISRFCLGGSSIDETALGVAERLNETGFWEQVVPLRLREGRHPGPLGERDPNAARLAHQLIKASPEALAGMVTADQEHLIFPPDDLDWIKAYRNQFRLGTDADAVLLVISTEESVEAGLLILSSHDLSEDPDERQLLNTIANSLSLLATRLADHERLEVANEELRHVALHDALTNLPNRRCLIEELERMLARGGRRSNTIHVAFIDLDDFKRINDHFGHDAGDEFLQQFSARLRDKARQGDLIARFGGDEFVFAGYGESTDNAIGEQNAILRRVRTASTGTYELSATTLEYQGPSIGIITWYPGEPVDADVVLARADEAMYADKQQRRRTTPR